MNNNTDCFVERFEMAPFRSGPLDGLTFTVKDNIHVKGRRTSYGNKSWQESHPPAVYNALCVDQLLAAGATCVGKVVSDEFTYSLAGENSFFGTPLNPKAVGRIPGGSSSGSASSVAGGHADFSVGTDSGGSVRVPASFCGVWGMRPSLHRISEAGVLPFMPSVSTVGLLAADFAVLRKAMRVVLRSGARPAGKVRRLVLLDDALSLADAGIRDAAERRLAAIAERAGLDLERTSLGSIVGDAAFDLRKCSQQALGVTQTVEFQNTVGDWIENGSPELGAGLLAFYPMVKGFDRTGHLDGLALCERLFESINDFMDDATILCFATTPTVAPLKGALSDAGTASSFYEKTLAVTSFAGVGRLPEISAPLLSVEDCPVGLSFVAGHYRDEFLLDAVGEIISTQ